MRLTLGGIVIVTVVLLAATPLAAQAPRTGKTSRIGYLTAGAPTGENTIHNIEAFQAGLRDLGWIEGRNLVIEFRFADGKLDRLPELATDLIRSDVNAILSFGNPANQAVKKATTTLPIVVISADPLVFGLVRSFPKPGGNITGLSVLGAEFSAKRIELLREMSPKVSRVAILLNPSNPAGVTIQKETEAAARSLLLTLESVPVADESRLDAAFAVIVKHGVEAVVIQHDPMLQNAARQIAALAAKYRLIALGDTTEFVAHGGLFSYGPTFVELHRQAAALMDKILKGAKPADLPVEQPTRFELAINLRTAKALGLTIPPSVLVRADRVFE